MKNKTNNKKAYDFARKLKKLRYAAGITQLQLAQKLNVSRSAVSNYENGMREPDSYIIKKIADSFDTSVDFLVGKSANSIYDDADEYINLYSFIKNKGDIIDISGISLSSKLAIIEYCEYLIKSEEKRNSKKII